MKLLSILILTLLLSGSAQAAGLAHLAARGGKSVAKLSLKTTAKGLHLAKKVLW